MNWLEFFSSVINSFVWPTTILIVIYLLKDNLISLLPYIQKVKLKDFEVELRETKKQFERFSPISIKQVENTDSFQLYQLAELSPRSAILEAWLLVEKSATSLVANKMKEDPGAMIAVSRFHLGKYLYENKLISKQQSQIFNNLRELRNKSVHLLDRTIKAEEASEYIDLAVNLAEQIRPK